MVNPAQLHGPQGPPEVRPARPARPAASSDATGFASALKDAIAKPARITFSAHAAERLESRGIQLSEDQQLRLAQALDEAGAKGVRDAVLFMDQTAFVANVPNRTVVTAVDMAEAGSNAVFTNVDGAVMITAPNESPTQSQSQSQPQSNGLDPFGGSPRAADR